MRISQRAMILITASIAGLAPMATITVARAGDTLDLAWFGVLQGDEIIAFGTLAQNLRRDDELTPLN